MPPTFTFFLIVPLEDNALIFESLSYILILNNLSFPFQSSTFDTHEDNLYLLLGLIFVENL